MSDFNYQKGFFVLAIPSWKALPQHVREVHSFVSTEVKDLRQGRDLNIPMSDYVVEALDTLTIRELAVLSRASYFVGHWRPSLYKTPFENSKGQSWKVSNCCDQILRRRLVNHHPLQIHEGSIRVTFSSRDCWLWEEFGLATEENIEAFETCGLPFGESTLESSARKLAGLIGDIWPDPDSLPDNEEYKSYLAEKVEHNRLAIKKQFEDNIAALKAKSADYETELNFLLLCNSVGISTHDVIHYAHIHTFTFNWRKSLSKTDIEKIKKILDDNSEVFEQYTITFA